MANERIFPKGLIAFKPKDTAPTWVKASVMITLDDFKAWVNGEGKEHLTDYNGKKQLKLQITETKDGKFSFSVDTFKPTPREGQPTDKDAPAKNEPFNGNSGDDSDLPF
jgi:hypothetical protein